jgi:hypothetical protein
MATPSLTPDQVREAREVRARHKTDQAAADELGISRGAFQNRIKRKFEPAVLEAAEAGGIEDLSTLSHFWKITKDDAGNGYSLFVKNPSTGDSISLADMVRETIAAIDAAAPITLPPRPTATGEHLLTIDLADVHFLKLCVKTETGYEYNRQMARHRVIEGTKALLKMAEPMGVGRILFVLGNDILHTDNPRSTTTSGTYQDSDGSLFQGFSDAALAIKEAIDEAAKVAEVDLLHCMSNHDWTFGWALSQTIAAHYRSSAGRVNATPYNLSEAHRKYYRFGNNLLGLTHGDGAKEEKLYGLMVKEARQHISECSNLYWYLHHVHHKMRKKRGEDGAYQKEKDHNGLTVVTSGQPWIGGENLEIEYVRSPSPPDGWHDRNGFVNRQAVECFLHHPTLGQRARFTEFF